MSRRMSKWDIDVRRGLGVGIGLMFFVTVVNLVLLWLVAELAVRDTVSLTTFVVGLVILFGAGLLGLISYWLYGLTHSVYLLDRNELIIRWGATEQTIPVGDIELVFTGDELAERVRFRGGGWPGHHVGFGEVSVPDAGSTPALFYATVPPRDQIYVTTPGLTYGISPAERDVFLESLQERMKMGPTQIVEQSSKRPGFLNWEIWRDRLAIALLAGGFLALLALIGLLCFRFPSLPRLVPLHFDAAGIPDRFASRGQVFVISLIGLVTFLLNGTLGSLAYRRERVIGYMLWSGAALVQLLLWAATLGLLGQV